MAVNQEMHPVAEERKQKNLRQVLNNTGRKQPSTKIHVKGNHVLWVSIGREEDYCRFNIKERLFKGEGILKGE